MLADPCYADMSKEDQDILIKEVEAAREVKKLGARVTNKSAAQDYRASMEAIDDIVSTYAPFISYCLHLLNIGHRPYIAYGRSGNCLQ